MKVSEGNLEESLISEDQSQQKSPIFSNDRYRPPFIDGSNILSSIFFVWVYPLISLGWKTTISLTSIPKLPQYLGTQLQQMRIKMHFESTSKSNKAGMTLFKVLAKTYYRQFLSILGFMAVFVTIQSINPYLTATIMHYISTKEDKQSAQGWFLFSTILLLQTTKSLCEAQVSYRFTKLGINMTNSLTLLLFTKSLKYQCHSSKQFSQSDIVNYSQVDAERMSSGGYQIASLLLTPIQIVVGLIMMSNFIGVSFLAGLAVMVLILILTYFLQKISYRYNRQLLAKKDQRMKVTQEMLDIIRFIKINAIEKFFYGKVTQKRKEEVEGYRKKGMMDVVTTFVYWSMCPLILSVTFITYALLGNEINSEVAFTTIMIFTTLQNPIGMVPISIASLVQMVASIKRIEKFLYTGEIQDQHVHEVRDEKMANAIVIDRGNFYYGKENIKRSKGKDEDVYCQAPAHEIDENEDFVKILKDINLSLRAGKLTMIMGSIGSGKSSILLSILNEIPSSPGSKVTINGSIAYSAQKPWIMSATVKDNIVFESTFDQEKLDQVVYYSCLKQDLQSLPLGLQTQIGQKGINLSGGQKARLGLARALYSQRDIYFLDDILSAVDVHVGEFIMNQTVKGYLKGKTVVMPTHAIKFADMADDIVIMEKGGILLAGRGREVIKSVDFRKLVQSEQPENNQNNSGIQSKQEPADKRENIMSIGKSIRNKIDSNISTELEPITTKVMKRLMLPQDQQIGAVNYKIFKQYIHLNGGYLSFALIVVLAMALWMAFNITALMFMEQWCESPIEKSHYLYLYVCFIICSSLFILLRAYKLVLSGSRQGMLIHSKMTKALLYASLGDFFNRVPVGRIVNRLTKDLRQMDETIGLVIGSVLVNSFGLLGNLIICIYGSSVIVIGPMLLAGFIAYWLRKYYMRSQIEVTRYEKCTNSPIVTGFISTISGLATIRAYQLSSNFTQRQRSFLDRNKRVRLTRAAMNSWFSVNLTYVSFMINMASIGYCLLSANSNPALAGLLMTYALTLSSDITKTTDRITLFESKLISLQRVFSFTQIEPEPAYIQYCSENWSEHEQGYHKVIEKGQIQFRNVSARYQADLPDSINSVNAVIRSGEKVGIIGRTGAGKSTLVNTLLRITHISSGELLIDGKKIEDYSLKDLRNAITMIDQEPTLIHSTFRQNLDLTRNHSDQYLLTILSSCNLDSTVNSKGGLSGLVSNQTLSAGQKQLLCICRALIKHSKIVLIDEATANIDMKNDATIQKVITQQFRTCTVLTIAHRLSTLNNVDKIMVMNEGQVVEFGSPEELSTNQNGWYRSMLANDQSQLLN